MAKKWATASPGSQKIWTRPIAHARRGWALAQEKITSGAYDLILPGRVHLPAAFWLAGYVSGDRLAAPQQAERASSGYHGRDAPAELLDYADLVTEMKVIKHPIRSRHPGASWDRLLISGPTHAHQKIISQIRPLDPAAMQAARARQNQLTKPPGSLGRLEELSIRIAGITR